MISLQPATHRLVSLYFLAIDWHYELPETTAVYVPHLPDVAFNFIRISSFRSTNGLINVFEREIPIH